MAKAPPKPALVLLFALSVLWAFGSTWLAFIRLIMGDVVLAAAFLISGVLVFGLGMFALVRAGGDE